jgi:signal peptide peptidase SppA
MRERKSTWGILEDAVPLISRHLRGEVGEAQVRAVLESEEGKEAATRMAAAATGSVAVIPLQGVITPRGFMSIFGSRGGGLQEFRRALREAVGSQDIGTIVLAIDSPGGRCDLVPETAAEVREATKSKRVVSVANTLAASAAYWIGSQADEFIVTPSGDVGSIGVFCVHEDFSGYDERLGIKTTLISAGKYKTEGNPYEPLSDGAREAIQEGVDAVYDLFLADVAKGRGASMADVRRGYGEGRCVDAKRALELNLVDRVATFEEALSELVRDARSGRRAEEETTENFAGAAGEDADRLAEIRDALDKTTKSLKED